MYITLSDNEKAKLLGTKPTEKYSLVGHSFIPLNGVGKNYCKGCGLVALRNKATAWCIEKGCKYDLHSQYKLSMKRLTKNKAK